MAERKTTITQTYSPVSGRSVTVRNIPAHEVSHGSESEIMLDVAVVERVQELVDFALSSSSGDNIAVMFDSKELSCSSGIWLVGATRTFAVSEALSALIARVSVVENILKEPFTIDIAMEHALPSLLLRSGSAKTYSTLYIAYQCAKHQREPLISEDAVQLDRGLAALRLLAGGNKSWSSVWLWDKDRGIQLDEHIAASVRSCRIRLRNKTDASAREDSVVATIEKVQLDRFAARFGDQSMEFRYDESLKPDIFEYFGLSARIFYAK